MLPIRILPAAPAEPIVSVDGAFGARGLNLSHWPGNTTPVALRHELSTGSALLYARLPRAERERLAAGASCIANNHYDTDGACALFAVSRPESALEHERALLDAAAAGDFFRVPSELAFCIDAVVTNLADPERSPLAREVGKLEDSARHERCYHWLFEHFPALLSGEMSSVRGLFEPELDALRADMERVRAAVRAEDQRLDLATWNFGVGAGSEDVAGRHALFGASARDRQLVSFGLDGGWCHRLLFSTLSWFDIPGRRRQPRPDLRALATRLNAIEEVLPSGPYAWRAQDPHSPSPELWFGLADVEPFTERNAALRPSRIRSAGLLEVLRPVLAGG